MKVIEHILYYILLILMLLPAFQKESGLVREPELEGDFNPAEKPLFTWGTWMNGSYQAGLDQYLNDNTGFNPTLIRLNNQLDYSLFRYIHADGVVQGRGGHLFEYDYIRAYTGKDFIGEKMIDKKMRRLKFIQQYLKDSLNIDLIFVLEPGKASFYPEFIPEKYLVDKKEVTNYSILLNKAKTYGISFIDLNAWFKILKPEAPYPIYGQYGTHWSSYGMSLAVDSLLKLIGQRRSIQLRKVTTDTFLIEKKARKPDYDMAAAMNLLFRLKDREPLAYPVYSFDDDKKDKDFPMVLVVGDSYYWNIVNTRIPAELFRNEAFWYFGKLVYPEFYAQPVYVKDLNIREEVEKQDVILLMTTERFLYKFDWNFIDALYSIYGVNSAYDRTYDYASQITINDEWFSLIIGKAKRQHKKVEEMLEMDAQFTYHEQEPQNYAVYYGVSEMESRIRKDKEWLESVRQKATESNTPIDDMIRLDAEYMLSTTNPEAYQTFLRIKKNREAILNDSILVEETKREASYYLVDFEEMLYINAERMMRHQNR